MKVLKAGDRVILDGVVRFLHDFAVWEFEGRSRVWEIRSIDHSKREANLISGGYGVLHDHPKYGEKPGYTYGSGSVYVFGDDFEKIKRTKKELSFSDKYILQMERQRAALAARRHSGEHFFKLGMTC